MGILDKLHQAARKRRRQMEEDQELARQMDEEWAQAKDELWDAIGQGLEQVGQNVVNHVTTLKQREEKLQNIIKNPTALDSLSDVEIEHLEITTEAELEALGSDVGGPYPDQLYGLAGAITYENIQNKRLLLRLIKANKERRSKPKPKQPTSVSDRRKELTSQIQDLMAERSEMRKQLIARHATADEIKQLENLYDDAIHKKQLQLRKILES